VRNVAHEAVHEFLHLDGKIIQTLKLLVSKPGELTLEYFRGRRARYISPVRLYLTCSLLFFALAAVAPSSNNFKVKATDAPTPEVEEMLHKAEERMTELRREMPHQVPRLMFVLLPVFALTTWAFYHRAQSYYVPHLYYAIHFHSFVFLTFAVATVLKFGGAIGSGIGGVLALTVFPYHYMALRRTFGGSRVQVAWKGTTILVIYLLVLVSIFTAALYFVIRLAIADAHLHAS
jgi:hypothetical protein